MEFGNLKKRLALGLAGVMAFTMAAPVGLTTGQEAEVAEAAEAFTFIASPTTTVEQGTAIKVGEINTGAIGTLYDKQARMISVDADIDYGFATVTDKVNQDMDNYSTRKNTGKTDVQIKDNNFSVRTIGLASGVDDADGSLSKTKTPGAVLFFGQTPGTAALTIKALTEAKTVVGEQNIDIKITDPDSVSFDLRTGKTNKTIISAKAISNVESLPVFAWISTAGNAAVRSLRVDNSNTSLVKVSTDGNGKVDDEWNPTSNEMKWTLDPSSYPASFNKESNDYTASSRFDIIPNKNASGSAQLKVFVGYEKGGKEKWTEAKTLDITVNNKKNVLSVGYAGSAKQINLTSEELTKSDYYSFLGDTQDHVEAAVGSGWAMKLNNTTRDSQITATSDRESEGAKVRYTVKSSGCNADQNEGLDSFISVTNNGLVTLNSTLGKGVTRTGTIVVQSTPGTTAFDPSKAISIPVKISNKVDANISVYDEDGSAVAKRENGTVQSNAKNVKDEEATVWLSATDKPEKILTYNSNVDASYIEWTSTNKDITVTDMGNGQLKVTSNKKTTGEISSDITGRVKETPDTEAEINIQFKVKVTDKKLVNALTYDESAVYLNYDGNKTHTLTASYECGNSVKYEFVEAKSNGEYVKKNETNLGITTYGGTITLNNKNEGVALVRVSGDDNTEAKAMDYGIVRVYYNIDAEETVDTITTTEIKKSLTVGDTYQISAVSAKGDTLMFVSDDESVASVDPSTGLVTAKKPGMAVIGVYGMNYGGVATVAINVSEKPQDQDVVTGKASYSVKVGKTVTSDAESSLGNALTWSSSNTKVATVSKTGVIKGVKAGKAVVTATAKNSGAKLEINVTVSKNNQSLTVTGKTVTKKVALNKKNKTTKKVTISKAAALTVKNAQGTVTYKKAKGNSKITVNSKTGKITVKKGIKKGTYKVQVTVNAAGNNTYNKASKTATVTIVIKKK